MAKTPNKSVKTTTTKKTVTAQPSSMARKTGKGLGGLSPNVTRRSQRSDDSIARHNQNGFNLPLPRWHWQPISEERKLDILGIILALLGVLFFISLITRNNPFSGSIASALYESSGWGTFLLPLGLFALGIWFILRNNNRLPMLSVERIVGIILAFLTLVTLFHIVATGGIEPINDIDKRGGGLIGGIIGRILIRGFGEIATIIILLAMALISIVLIFDLSVPDLWKRFKNFLGRFNRSRSVAPPTAGQSPQITFPPAYPPQAGSPLQDAASENLPQNFTPLDLQSAAQQPVSSRASGKPSVRNAVAISGTAVTSGSTVAATSPNATPPPAAPVVPEKVWELPSPQIILDPPTPASMQNGVEKDNAGIIEKTLASFGVPGHIVDVQRGPTVTMYGLEPDFIETRNGRTRVRVSKIVSLADDLALALAAQRIRIQAPVPGRNFVGIEVPNSEISRVSLLEVLESDTFKKIKSQLKFTLGKNVSGQAIGVDLAAMPHLLIAGTTGSGKSVCVNSILACLLLNNTPLDLRLVLVDPKRVELTGYNGIPHLLTPVIVEVDRVVGALQWMQREMEGRYQRFAQAGVRNILEYNARFAEQKLPYIVIIIDELADLMMLAPDETERSIARLAQLARATGIHLILATQRPSVDVITGVIKANFPARIAFTVASGIDSRVILDQPGAERLLGRGDMLFQSPDAPAPVRLQGTYVSDSEIVRLVESWKTIALNYDRGEEADPFANASFEMMSSSAPLKQGSFWEEGGEANGKSSIIDEAIAVVRREKKASISLLQRKMSIGYARAARIIDELEERGIVGPQTTTSQVREVLDYGDADSAESDTAENE